MAAPAHPAIAAIVAYVAASADIQALVDTRVYGDELPGTENPAMPKKAVVLKSSGGRSRLTMPLRRPVIDAWCVGETRFEAQRVEHAVYTYLTALNRAVVGDRLLHWADLMAGPFSGMDRDSKWPSVVSTYQIEVSEIAVS